ncbi:DUF1737 domain-containing protein [Clostridium estertheticum]|uniref:DUF1737 domain-containing protein n=1 Tax=Clostridium estertheticum TaxID=238834 RepID=UPI001C7D0AC4|nr:DUF1737 domain-containing protein [Clostridium estertheticum]MBX4261977.1 DUF1737 domain-containing protein [Clostridium estertheticum]WLC68663.1 DUF1737 domain-containing protein [Clostridium estertheticum]
MEDKLKYRLITGKDDVNFCKKISELLNEGYKLYEAPSCTFNGQDVIVAQALILNECDNLDIGFKRTVK